jgi:hypothetical protein
MVRPLRLEFPDTLYHLTAWDNAQQDIYVDDPDRQRFLEVLAREILCVKRIDMYYWPSENERVMSGKVAIGRSRFAAAFKLLRPS